MHDNDNLSILKSLEVRRPCHESWEQMRGDEKSRFCAQCSHSVTNLSAMTQQETLSLVSRSTNTSLCVRYEKNTDGSIKFQPKRKWGASIWQTASVFVASVLVLLGFQSSLRAKDDSQCDTKDPKKKSSQPAEEVTMGVPLLVPEPTPTPTPKPSLKPALERKR